MTPSKIWANAERKDANNVMGLDREAEHNKQGMADVPKCARDGEDPPYTWSGRVVGFSTV